MKTILQLKKQFIIPLFFLMVGNVCVGQNSISINVPWISQYKYGCNESPPNSSTNGYITSFCGHTCTEMTLGYFEGRTSNQLLSSNIYQYNIDIENQFHSGNHDNCGTGTPNPNHLIWLFNQKGYEAKYYCNPVLTSYGGASGSKSFNNLITELNNGNIVFFQCGIQMQTGTSQRQRHWMLLVGYDSTTNEVIVNDPGRGSASNGDHFRYSLSTFNASWSNSYNIALVVNKKSIPNQNLSIYGGTIANPKDLNIYIDASEISSSNFTIPHFNIQCPNGNILHITSGIYSKPTVQVGNKTWYHFGVSASEISNNSFYSSIPSNGYPCNIGFDVTVGSTTKHFHGDKQLYFLDPSTLTDIGTTDDKWYDKYVKDGVDYGLFRGGSPSNTTEAVSFNPSGLLTKSQAAVAVVLAGVKLGILNINTASTQNASYAYYDDVPPSNPYFKYVQTLKNYGITGDALMFGKDEYITQDRFCKWVALACNITAADINQMQYINTAININYTSTDATLQPYVDIMTKTPSIRSNLILGGEEVKYIEPLYSAFDYSTQTTFTLPTNYVCNKNVTRDIMAKVMTLTYEFKRLTASNAQDRSANNTNSIPSDFIAYGEKFDNASITSTSTPVTPTQQTYSCASGGSIDIYYNPGTLPQHYYWSMQKSNGSNIATLTSNNSAHSSVTFTAPTVTTPTQWKLYTYTANNKGKARETFITINVEPTSVSVPIPSYIDISSYSSDGIEIEWDGVGNGITNYQAQYSQDPSFNNNVVSHNVTSSNLTMYWTVQGLQNGTYYARVKSINSNGVSSSWSNVVSYSLNPNTQPFISMVTPTSGTTISGTSVTLNFQATGGNAPLTYIVYFSTWNPLGNPAVATNLSNATFTVNNLTPNNTYFWAVKVVDADGDEFFTNNYSINTQPSTTIPTGTISIENGVVSTNSISVNLNVTATAFNNGTITGMRFSNDGITWSDTWEQYNLNRPAWSLFGYGGTSAPGNKTVYVQFRDNSGNVSQTYSDNITLVVGAKGIFIVRDKSFESLVAANNYAVSGDTIYATAGYFDLTSEINSSSYLAYSNSVGAAMKNGVSLVGEGANKTTLFWDGMSSMFGGLACSGNNTIQGLSLIVSVNQSYSRATLMLHGASNVIVKNCVIKNGYNAIECFNYNGTSGNSSNITIQDNLIISNYSKSIHVRNCSGLNIYNNTIDTGGYATVFLLDNTSVNFKNNIVANSKAEGISIYPNTSIVFTNNNIFNNRFSATSVVENYTNSIGYVSDQTGINGNISIDPLYVNSASNNFNLNNSSPCANTGTNVGLPFYGVAPEIGAFELGGSGSITLNSNVTTSFLVTKPDGTQQTYTNGQTISNLAQGIYGIYPQAKVSYYPPNDGFVYLNINETKTYTGNYTLDTQGPEGRIYLNGNVYNSQSPYVTIFCDVIDKINGLQNGQMQFSNDGINWTNPEPIKNKKLLWDLSNGNITSLYAGSKTVYAKFSDNNGYWSNVISDDIEYIPSGKIKIIQPNNNISNLDFRNDILNSQLGDILLLKEGTHTIFGGAITIPIGLTLQGVNKFNSIIRNVSSIYFTHGFKYDNLKFYAPSTQQFYSNLSDSEEPLKSIISNCIFDHNSVQLLNRFNATFTNNIFKDSSLDTGLLKLYSNNALNKIRIMNNVFDASVNTSTLNTEIGVNSRLCCANNFEIKNNNFIGFNIGTETGVYMGGAIQYTNSTELIGDMQLNNNNFYDCLFKIKKFNGVDITKDKFSYSYNPVFNPDYSLPTGSPLFNSGCNDMIFNDHDNTINDIGINGGIYYNTPPTVEVVTEEVGFNQFKFIANSVDGQTPITSLQYRWDFNNDGIMDTPFLLTNEIARTVTTTTDMIVCYVFDELFAIGYQIIPTPIASNISLSIIQPQALAICAGSSSPFQTNATGNFNQGCEFKIVYSSPNGDFSNTQFTQNLTTQPNGIVNVTFPDNLPTCTTCYLKLVSTSPVYSSSITLAAVYQAPQATIAITPVTTTICPNQSVTFTATPTNGGTTPTYTWKKNGVTVGSNTATYTTSGINNNDIVWCEMVSNQACASTVPTISTPTTIYVTQIDTPFIQAIDNILAASTDLGIQWIRNGQSIVGANSQFYEATQTGFYQFSVTINGCTVLSDIYQLTSLGAEINEFDNSSLKVYPNPFSAILNIEVKEDYLQSYQIIDLQGRLIKQEKANGTSHQINLDSLPQSVYILEIITDKGRQRVKIVKK